jgi:NitT/TauT family transport system substrate-binding protein
MQLTRRCFVTNIVVGIASFSFMKGLSAAQLRGKLGYMKIIDTAAMFMAVEKGFFTAEGLELEPVPTAGGALMVQGVTSGAWIDKNGADSSTVKFVELPFPQMEAALIAGRVDAVSIHEPFATAALEKAATRVLAHPWGDVIAKFLIAGWFASGT